MPEGEPEAQRLSHVHQEGRHGPAITDESDDHRAVDYRLELALLEDVKQEAREEGARAQRDDGEIEEDPEAEGEAVIHVGLVEPLDKAEAGAIEAEGQQQKPGQNPEQKLTRRRTADAASISALDSALVSAAGLRPLWRRPLPCQGAQPDQHG